MSLVSKDESLATSMVHIGYIVLQELEASGQSRMSLASVMHALKKKKIVQYRPIMFALLFLHLVGAIDFDAPYIYRV